MIRRPRSFTLFVFVLVLLSLAAGCWWWLHEPADPRLAVRLVATSTTYSLEKGFRQRFDAAQAKIKRGDHPTNTLPPPPRVDLELQIHNVSTEAVELWPDFLSITWELQGPGAVVLTHVAGAFPLQGKSAVLLPPGQSHAVRIAHLANYHFDPLMHHACWWTEPGDYTLAAKIRLGGPAGSEHARTRAVLESAPVRVKVVETP